MTYRHTVTVTNLKYYRCTGLGNATYKLWTRVVTIPMADYGERNTITPTAKSDSEANKPPADQIETPCGGPNANHLMWDMYLLQMQFSVTLSTMITSCT